MKNITVNELKNILEKLIEKGYGDKEVVYDDQRISYCDYEEEMDSVVMD